VDVERWAASEVLAKKRHGILSPPDTLAAFVFFVSNNTLHPYIPCNRCLNEI
jgi:hypothetical protein